MSGLRVGMIGFDITPRFHPTCGAWGCTPAMTELDMPLLARCLALAEEDRLLVWFSADLIGETVRGIALFSQRARGKFARRLGIDRDERRKVGRPLRIRLDDEVLVDDRSGEEPRSLREHLVHEEAGRLAVVDDGAFHLLEERVRLRRIEICGR